MTIEIAVDGLDFMFYQLRQMEKATSRKILRSAMRVAAKPMLNKAKALVPYKQSRTGYALRNSIKLQLEPSKTRISEVQFRLGVAPSPRTSQDRPGVAVAGGLSSSARSPNYGLVIEGGRRLPGARGKKRSSTVKRFAQPFLLPAFDQHVEQVIREFGAQITQKVTAELKKKKQ